jgi:heme A synthase
VVLAAVLLLLVSMTGAVTALGDTVYPVQGSTPLEHLQRDQAEGAHFLGKLRIVHPLLAVLGVGGLWVAGSRARSVSQVPLIQRLGGSLYWGGALALGVGLLNVTLGAPGYLQVIHLAVACMLWLATVLLASALWDAGK